MKNITLMNRSLVWAAQGIAPAAPMTGSAMPGARGSFEVVPFAGYAPSAAPLHVRSTSTLDRKGDASPPPRGRPV